MSTESGTPGDVRIMIPLGAAPCGLLTGDRQRHVLEVADVDGAGLESRDDRSLQGTRTTGVVTGGRDGRTLLEGRRVRAGEPDGELRGDLDVQDPGDTAGAEEVRLAARLPDHRGVDEGTGLDGLERVDPDVALDDRFFTDEALVADHGAVLDPRGPHDVGVLPDHTATQIAVFADEHVVVHDRTVQEGARFHDDVGADDGVLADLGVGLDLGVVTDVQRSPQHGVGMDVRAFRHPHAGRDLEAVQLHVDLALQHVGLGLHIAFVRADVLPVALRDVAADQLAFLHELREDIP